MYEVEKNIMRLLYPYNMALFLRYIQGESFNEIAGKLGYTYPGTPQYMPCGLAHSLRCSLKYDKKYCNQLTHEGEKLYAALLPLNAANKWNPKNDLKFYRANNLYMEYKKKLSSLSELKTEVAIMRKDVDIRGYRDRKFAGYIAKALVLRGKQKLCTERRQD